MLGDIALRGLGLTVADDGSTTNPVTIPLEDLVPLGNHVPCPIWTPDGRWVALGGAGAVWVVDTQTAEIRQLAGYPPPTSSGDRAATSWTSPATRRPRMHRHRTRRSRSTASTPAPPARSPTRLAAHLTWSPDGATLAFTHGENLSGTGIWLVDSDGRNLRRLAERAPDAVHGIDIVWSPRGDQIAYQTHDRRLGAVRRRARHGHRHQPGQPDRRRTRDRDR